MRLVVTGAAGFIGSTLCGRLVADGHDVLGIDCLRPTYGVAVRRRYVAGLDPARFRLVHEDVTGDGTDLAGFLRGAAAVFHLAGRPGVRESWGAEFGEYLRDNVLATQRVCAAAASAGVPRVVLASSSSVYGDHDDGPSGESDAMRPVSPYGVTKLAAENVATAFAADTWPTGFGLVTLRYFSVYGPRQRPDMAVQRFVLAALRGDRVDVFGDGGQRRDMTYVDDCVEATARALTWPPGTYNVAGGASVTLDEIVAAVESATGRHVGRRAVSAAPGDVRATEADITRLGELGWSPEVTLAEGVARQVAWVRGIIPVSHGRSH